MSTRQYIGARYVPKFYQNSVDGSAAWESNVVYEPLTWVTLTNGHIYLSRKQVPATVGIPSQNIDYWLDIGSYNGFIDDLQDQIDVINTNITALADKIDFLTPEMFGAKGDGSTDDITAFNACIAEAISSHTAIVLQASKIYCVSTPIVLNHKVKIFGMGATIKAITSGMDSIIKFNMSDRKIDTETGLYDIVFDCDYKSESAIKVVNCVDSWIEHIHIKNPTAYGFNITAGYGLNVSNVELENLNAIDNLIAIKHDSSDCIFRNIVAVNYKTFFRGGYGDFLENCHPWFGSDGTTIARGSKFLDIIYTSSLIVDNCYVDSYDNVIYIDSNVSSPLSVNITNSTWLILGNVVYDRDLYIVNNQSAISGITDRVFLSNFAANATAVNARIHFNNGAFTGYVDKNCMFNNMDYVVTDRLVNVTGDFTAESGYTINSESKVYKIGRHVSGFLIIEKSTDFVQETFEKVATIAAKIAPRYTPSFQCTMFGTNRWAQTIVGTSYTVDSDKSINSKCPQSGQDTCVIYLDYYTDLENYL